MEKTIELRLGDLKRVLAGIGKVAHGRSALPALGCVKLAPDADGCSTISGTDLDSTVSARIGDAHGLEPVLVPLESLSRLAKSLPPTEHLTIRRAEKPRVALGYQRAGSRVEQPVESPSIDEWPVAPQVKQRLVPVDAAFKQAFRQALECASSDSSRYVLNGVCIDISQPDCHCIVATDGRHLYSANTFKLDLATSVIVPAAKFLNWSPFHEDGDWQLSVEPGTEAKPTWIRIQSHHWVFVSKAVEGAYPKWRDVIPEFGPRGTRATLSQESATLMLDVLPRLPGVNESNQSVKLVFKENGLSLHARAKETDWTEVPVPGVAVQGQGTEVSLNRSYVAKALRFGFTEITVRDPLSPVLFTSPGRRLLVMPLRMDGPATQPQDDPPPTEAAGSASPSTDQPDNPTEQRNAMATTTNPPMTPPERRNIKATNGETQSAISTVVEHVEAIKTRLKDVIGDLSKTIDLLKAAEKEKKATLKEVETERATLRSLQKGD